MKGNISVQSASGEEIVLFNINDDRTITDKDGNRKGSVLGTILHNIVTGYIKGVTLYDERDGRIGYFDNTLNAIAVKFVLKIFAKKNKEKPPTSTGDDTFDWYIAND